MREKPSDEGALAGVRVVDVTGTVATGYCGRLFAEYGAQVIDAEPPHGAPTRALPPHVPGVAAPESSALHAWLSNHKHSIVIDRDTERGRRRLRALVATADVVLEDEEPEALERLGLQATDSSPVIGSVTWFGRSGPYAGMLGSDAICQALIGLVRGIGPAEGPPLLPSGHHAQIIAGLTAFIPLVARVLGREIGHVGSGRIETSAFEANLCLTDVGAVMVHNTGLSAPRMGINRFPPTYPLGIHRCRDGWIGVTVLTPSQWHAFCTLLGLDDLAHVARYQTALGRLEEAEALEPRIRTALGEWSAAELFHAGQAERIPLALVPTPAEAFAVDQFAERAAFAPIRHPDQGVLQAPRTPFRLFGTPGAQSGDAPRLGAGDERLDDRQHHSTASLGNGSPSSVRPEGLLSGIRIVDLSMGWAGPLATRQLADLGAEVVKIESCERFDWWRGWEATAEWIADDQAEKAVPFNTVNRGKLDVTLDLTSAAGKTMLEQLVANADAVVENYSSGVLRKLGLDYPALARVNPELVMLSMPAFGSYGPWRDYRAYGSTVEHASGLPHTNGWPDQPPTMLHVAYGDPIAGLNGAAALLTALRHRKRTGRGQHCDLSQAECLFPLGAHAFLAQTATGHPPRRPGNRTPDAAPHGVFPCAGSDQWVVIQVFDEAQWAHLRELSGAALAAFGELTDRLARVEALEAALASWTRRFEASALMETLQAAGIPAAKVQHMGDLIGDPHLQARGFWQYRERAYVGKQPHPSAPYRDPASGPLPVRAPAPTLGEHNRMMLGERLSLETATLDRLEREGVIGYRPVMPSKG